MAGKNSKPKSKALAESRKAVGKAKRAVATAKTLVRAYGRKSQARSRGRPQGPMAMSDASTILQHNNQGLEDIIEHDEFIADILGSGGLGNVLVQSFSINPGIAATFPIGSAECKNWTEWSAVSIEPYLLHEVSEFATDGSTGKLYLACDYNPNNLVPTTKQQLAAMHSASCMPCQDVGLKLFPHLLNRADYKSVRIGPVVQGTDLRLSDGGKLYVASIGQTGSTKVSELRIRYKFRLRLPTLLNQTGVTSTSTTTYAYGGGNQALTSTVLQTVLWTLSSTDPLGFGTPAAGVFTPAAGNYLINANIQIRDPSGEVCQSWLYAYKNGVQYGNYFDQAASPAAPTNFPNDLQMAFVIAFNGTDTFQFKAQATFATAGTVISNNNSSMIVTLA